MTQIGYEFIIRFSINMFSVIFLIYGCYFWRAKNHLVASSLVLFGAGIFVITYVLKGAEMSMGFSFGLFAVFTMLRYRTLPISIKEMTYLFLVIAISLLSSVSTLPALELMLIIGMLCLIALIIDSKTFQGKYEKQKILFEKIDLIKPENRLELISDIQERTGLEIKSINIKEIDFLRDVAKIEVEYLPKPTLVGALVLDEKFPEGEQLLNLSQSAD